MLSIAYSDFTADFREIWMGGTSVPITDTDFGEAGGRE
jgi:hypothetical protein